MSSQHVPGKLHCIACGFTVLHQILDVQSGTVGTEQDVAHKREPCPNGCTINEAPSILKPVTWEAEARTGWVLLEQMFDEVQALRAYREQVIARAAGRAPDVKGKPLLQIVKGTPE